jgi:isopentenyl-diphosphate delta-isomerase
MESVILVDDKDVEVGVMEKMEAHLTGTLHRAISIFIFNKKGEFLIQQRAYEKYHSGGKWSTYRAELDNALVEHEYDHVFIGISDEQPKPHPAEVAAFKYISREELDADIHQNPGQYSEWFKLCFERTNYLENDRGNL